MPGRYHPDRRRGLPGPKARGATFFTPRSVQSGSRGGYLARARPVRRSSGPRPTCSATGSLSRPASMVALVERPRLPGRAAPRSLAVRRISPRRSWSCSPRPRAEISKGDRRTRLLALEAPLVALTFGIARLRRSGPHLARPRLATSGVAVRPPVPHPVAGGWVDHQARRRGAGSTSIRTS